MSAAAAIAQPYLLVYLLLYIAGFRQLTLVTGIFFSRPASYFTFLTKQQILFLF
jgi:hypothetical protein